MDGKEDIPNVIANCDAMYEKRRMLKIARIPDPLKACLFK